MASVTDSASLFQAFVSASITVNITPSGTDRYVGIWTISTLLTESPSSVTVDGNSAGSPLHTQAVDDGILSYYGYVAPAASALDVVATYSGGGLHYLRAVAFDGINQSTPTRDFASATVGDAPISVAPDSNAGDFVVDGVAAFSAANHVPAPDGGQTQFGYYRNNPADEDSEAMYGSYKTGGAGTTSMGWDATGYQQTSIAVSLIPAGAAGSTANLLSGKFGALVRGKL